MYGLGMTCRVGMISLGRERRAELDHELRSTPVGERRGAEERVVGAEDRDARSVAESNLGSGVGEHGIARDLGEPRHGAQELGRVVVRATEDEPAPERARRFGEALDRTRRRPKGLGSRVGLRGVRRVREPCREQVRLGKERLAKREVEMDGALRRAPCLRGGPSSQGCRVVEHRAGILGGPNLHEPAHLVSEEPYLIDRLRRAGVAKLGRPVGGGEDERDARRGCLDDRGEEISGGAARRAHERDRPTRGFREAQREKSGGALVEADAGPDRRSVERERERGGARSGAEKRFAHSRRVKRHDESGCPGHVERSIPFRRGVRADAPLGISRARSHPEFPSS